VGNGSPSSTINRRRKTIAATIPSTPAARPQRAIAHAGGVMLRKPIAGTGPGRPSTNPMIAADDAVVWVMLFSSTPK
jgi:hypothetical protein